MKKTSRGQTLVEFSLLLIILVIIFLLVLDAGRAFYIHSVITNAAREGARYGITHLLKSTSDETTLRDQIVNIAGEKAIGVEVTNVTSVFTYVNPDTGTVSNCSTIYDNWPGKRCTFTSVTVEAEYSPITPLIGTLMNLDGPLTLRSTSKMTNEY
jgi:Flp pilus assembly protein TadG